jgi:hypothetical protein
MVKQAYRKAKGFFSGERYHHLERYVIQLNSVDELKKVFGWKETGILDRPDIHEYSTVEDVNERRIRDAEVISTVMRNVRPKTALEIGTADGLSTVLMAVNSPESRIYTVNIPPDEIRAGKGGKHVTGAWELDRIGRSYKERGLKNITQILANTATWVPDIGEIGVSFIDGCHDTRFVYNDTKKVMANCPKGGFVLWHDFNPGLTRNFDWIGAVCRGVELLIRNGIINARIFLVKDSWVGVFKNENTFRI